MISPKLDPNEMPEGARQAEVAHILALGYLRLKFRQEKSNCLLCNGQTYVALPSQVLEIP